MMNIRKKIILSELLTTDALVNSVRILYILKFVQEADFIGYLNFALLASMFLLEIPSGYIGDRFGNKKIVIYSKVCFILSIALLIFKASKISFLLSFIFLGFFSALESGAKNSYFLQVCEDYKELRVSLEKYRYAVSFLFSVMSSILFHWKMEAPFYITILIAAISLVLVLCLPKENIEFDLVQSNNIFVRLKVIMHDIINNRAYVKKFGVFTIISTVTIYVFYYYGMFFKDNQIPEYAFGLIYSTFSLLGIIGVKLYQEAALKKLGRMLKLLFPLSFLMIGSNHLILLALAVILQEIMFSYISVEFEITTIAKMEGRSDSSQFQSTISFFYSALRMLTTAVITTLMGFVGMRWILVFITAIAALIVVMQLTSKEETT